jgi:WD40 repeat protein
MPVRRVVPLLGVLGLVAGVSAQPPAPAVAPAPPDFARDVVPILESNCLRCHNSAKVEGGLLLESHEDLMRGGDSGSPLVAGKPDESPLILQIEGRAKPKMPPKKDLQPDEIAVLRAWVAAGAPYSKAARASLDTKVPALTQTAHVVPQVTSLAWRPDGRQLAVAGYKQVRRLTMPGGAEVAPLTSLADLVRAVTWSPDGSVVAVGGGTPGAFGEIVLFDAASGAERVRLEGHRDYVYHLAFNHDGTRLASCGYDKVIRVWDTATGRTLGALKEHTEAVYAVAFSGDGALLASAAADRSVKIWNVADGVRLYTITEPTDAVLTLAFRPGTRQLAAGGQDKRIRVWEIGDTAARSIRSAPAHRSAVLRVTFSADGRTLASTSTDKDVKLWDAETGQLLRVLSPQSDWAQALAFSPDSLQLAVGRYDGSVSIYDAASGRLVLEPFASGKVARR